VAAGRLKVQRQGLIMHIKPQSITFTALLGMLVALPSFGIDMNLPALTSIGASFGASAERAGLTMSLFMVGFAVAPPFCGPVSDRIGRKPIVLAAVGLFTAASIGCSVSSSLPMLLALRVLQGMGAGVAMTTAFAIVQDLFTGAAGRAKMSYVATLMLVIPMLAPGVGSAMLAWGDWRSIFGLLAGIGAFLLATFWVLFGESLRSGERAPLGVAGVLRAYREVSRSPICMTYILINSAAFAALFAYVSGSSIFFIDALGLSRSQYSVVFAITSLGIMASAFLNGKLSSRGVSPVYPLTIGVIMAVCSAAALLLDVLEGWSSVPCLVAMCFVASAGFGLIAPNALHAAMQPLPELAGSVSGVGGFFQVLSGSAISAFVVSVNLGTHGLSMAVAMLLSSSVAAAALFCLALPARNLAWNGDQAR
jgi:MFS transporter, DHA1 family, multidrug resistance protein